EEAVEILRRLSGHSHHVLTGVCLRDRSRTMAFTDSTEVVFRELTDKEINYYIDNYKPFDKAGAYGVQEWIGLAAITAIKGSYFNVMGLPVHRLYDALCEFCAE
ncbi:MAG: Maf family protein, partial [Bacteroidales bacterium]|nr:Maf family protein [Bacteroidales bacterium]